MSGLPVPHGFRLRFVLPSTVRLPFAGPEIDIERDGDTVVWLRSGPPGTELSDADVVALSGGPYPSESSARAAGEKWDLRLRRAFAAVGIAAKFERTAFGISSETLAAASAEFGAPVLPDNDGVITFPYEPQPRFIRFDVQGIVRPNAQAVLAALRSDETEAHCEARALLAYRLWAASDFVGLIPEARFSLLMIALECLAEPNERDGRALGHVETLIGLTKEAHLTDDERAPIVGALVALRTESSRRACMRLANQMSGRRYGDLDASAFIKRCYDRRNALVHGRTDHPSTREANILSANLSQLVGDLLAGRPLVELVGAVRETQAQPPA